MAHLNNLHVLTMENTITLEKAYSSNCEKMNVFTILTLFSDTKWMDFKVLSVMTVYQQWPSTHNSEFLVLDCATLLYACICVCYLPVPRTEHWYRSQTSPDPKYRTPLARCWCYSSSPTWRSWRWVSLKMENLVRWARSVAWIGHAKYWPGLEPKTGWLDRDPLLLTVCGRRQPIHTMMIKYLYGR